ncbi:MAG: TlpA disulfide reductase family protein [Rhodospirillales bacterium]
MRVVHRQPPGRGEHRTGWRGWASGLALPLIVAICSDSASAAGGTCGKPPETIARFEATKEPQPAPSDVFTDESDAERTLADYRGSGLIVNFWATWCAPCVKEMPALDRLAQHVKDDGIIVLALSADREGAPVVRKFYDKNDIDHLPVAIDRISRLARQLKVSGLPTTVMFNAAGQEVGRVVGAVEWDAPATVDFLRGCLAPAA